MGAYDAEKPRSVVKIAVDILAAVLFVLLLSTALVQETPHEWLGILMFVVATIHIVLNRKWIAAIPRGRYTALRVLQEVIMALLTLCILGQVVSSLILSKYAFGFLPAFPGAFWARRVHMFCSYWS